MFVLTFHYVEDAQLGASRKTRSITPEGLRNVIKTLRFLGFRIVSVNEALNDPSLVKAHNTALLTFDDGYENFHEHALPVLTQERCPATMFVLADKFSGTNDWDGAHLPVEEQDKLMSLEQLRDVVRSGWVTFGSHGLRHRRYSDIDPTLLRDEIDRSYDILSKEFGEAFSPVLAYPWGAHSDAVVEAMQTSSYKFAFTVEKGEWQDDCGPFEIPRLNMIQRDGSPLKFCIKFFKFMVITKARQVAKRVRELELPGGLEPAPRREARNAWTIF